MKGLLSLSFLLVLMLTSFQCEDEKVEFVFMILELPFTVTPENDSISVGDTLWITSDFPDTIREYNSGEYFKLEDFSFNFSLALRKLTSNQLSISQQPGATSSFNFHQEVGFISYFGETFSDFNLLYSQGRYKSRIGIIPQNTGVYCVNFLGPSQLDLKEVIDLGTTGDGQRRVPHYDTMYFMINDGLLTNFDLFKENCRAISLENPIPGNIYYEQKGAFTFRVVP